jgi:hypothetical protein
MPSPDTANRIPAEATENPRRPSDVRSGSNVLGSRCGSKCALEDQPLDCQNEIRREGTVDAADGTERRSKKAANRVGGEDATHANDVRPRRTNWPAAAKPVIIAAGKLATSTPMSAGPTAGSREIAGSTGAMTL